MQAHREGQNIGEPDNEGGGERKAAQKLKYASDDENTEFDEDVDGSNIEEWKRIVHDIVEEYKFVWIEVRGEGPMVWVNGDSIIIYGSSNQK